MHTMQTIVETYAVDWGGVYADNFETLYKEANIQGKAYWKDFVNPFNPSEKNNVLDYEIYLISSDKSKFKGTILYYVDSNFRKSTYDNTYGNYINYRIYGLQNEGNLLNENGKIFYLSND